jgi:hypothetical protein
LIGEQPPEGGAFTEVFIFPAAFLPEAGLVVRAFIVDDRGISGSFIHGVCPLIRL